MFITCPLAQRSGNREEPMAAVDSDHPCPNFGGCLIAGPSHHDGL